jgi:hypothetical protein
MRWRIPTSLPRPGESLECGSALARIRQRDPSHHAGDIADLSAEIEIILGLFDVIVELHKDSLIDAAFSERWAEVIRTEVAVKSIANRGWK